jgi:hypothetical protein
MTDPRTPESERKEAQLPDDLDQNPGTGVFGDHGSEDAQLVADDNMADGDVESGPAPESCPDDRGRAGD